MRLDNNDRYVCMSSNHASPVELAGFGAPGSGQDVEVVSDLVYLAHGGGGLRIIDLAPEYAQTIEVDLDIQPGSESHSVRLESRRLLPAAASSAARAVRCGARIGRCLRFPSRLRPNGS